MSSKGSRAAAKAKAAVEDDDEPEAGVGIVTTADDKHFDSAETLASMISQAKKSDADSKDGGERRVRKTELDRQRRARIRDMLENLKTKPRAEWTTEETNVFQQEEGRKQRKRERQNKRRSDERLELKVALDKPEKDRTPQDLQLIASSEQKRPQLSAQKRERQQERRDEAKRIQELPEAERSEDEKAFLNTFLAQRWRKVEGDRVRRLRSKLQKLGKSTEEIDAEVAESRKVNLSKKLKEEGKTDAEVEVALMALGDDDDGTALVQMAPSAGLARAPAMAKTTGLDDDATGGIMNPQQAAELDAAVNQVIEDTIKGKTVTTSKKDEFFFNRMAEMERIQAIPAIQRTADEIAFMEKCMEAVEEKRQADSVRRAKRQGDDSGAAGKKKAGEKDIVDKLDNNNARARVRYTSNMQRLKVIKARPKEEWTAEEATFVQKQEDRIARKNANSKNRRLRQKSAVEAILKKPEEERTEEDIKFLEDRSKVRQTKIAGDRLRRLQYKNVLKQDGISDEVKAKAARAVMGRNLDGLPSSAKKRKTTDTKTDDSGAPINYSLLTQATAAASRALSSVSGLASSSINMDDIRAKPFEDLTPEEIDAMEQDDAKKAAADQKDSSQRNPNRRLLPKKRKVAGV